MNTSDNHNEYSREFVISNRLGLHARASARLVQVAQQFQAEVELEKEGERVDAKSVLSLLTLACTEGTRVRVYARGADSEMALEALAELIQNKFGEE